MKTLTSVLTGNSTFNINGIMPNPDVLFGKSGVNMTVFEEMTQDAHIYAKLEQLKDSVLSMSWDIKPVSDDDRAYEKAAFVKEALRTLGVNSLLRDMMLAIEYGFSVVELVWELKEGMWYPKDALGRRADRFAFNTDGGLQLMDGYARTALDEKYKFIIHRNSPKNENPYGTPVLSKCYWPWMFKKAGFRYWLTVAEKYGVPTVLALFESLDDEDGRERAKELAQNLYNIQNDAAVALANVDSVQVLETKGTSDDFYNLVQMCNMEISKAITGEVLTSDTSSNASYSLSVQHQKTLDSKSRKVAAALAETLSRTLVAWISELNFGGDCGLEFVLKSEAEASWDIVKDAHGMGMDIDTDEVAKRFGIPVK
ncbi:MAG: DUF935 family protein [Deferribacterales bacterium]